MDRTRGRTRARPLALGAAAGAVVAACAAAAVAACAATGGAPFRAVDGGAPARGVRALGTYGCGSCHVIPGAGGAAGRVGPPLTGFGRRTYVAGLLPNTQENLVRWIERPQAVSPGNAMPDLGVTDQDARDIAAYLYTLH